MSLNKNLKISSNKSFGILFFFVFLIVSLWPIKNGEEIRLWALIFSLLFLILGILNSKLLTPLNKTWFKFGIKLGSIVSPIVMAVIFFLVVTPIGTIMRLLGKDVLRINNKRKSVSTYWINRDGKNNTMKKQF